MATINVVLMTKDGRTCTTWCSSRKEALKWAHEQVEGRELLATEWGDDTQKYVWLVMGSQGWPALEFVDVPELPMKLRLMEEEEKAAVAKLIDEVEGD